MSMLHGFKDADLGPYNGGSYTSNSGQNIKLKHVTLPMLKCGLNENQVIVGKVVGIVPYDEPIPL